MNSRKSSTRSARLLLAAAPAALLALACVLVGCGSADVTNGGPAADVTDVTSVRDIGGPETVAPDVSRDIGPLDGKPHDDTVALPNCDEDPGAFLCPCLENEDCTSGYCVPYGDGSVCTVTCLQECPDEWLCKSVVNTWPDVVFICVPEQNRQCEPCTVDQDCAAAGDLCLPLGEGAGLGTFCFTDCALNDECPTGYTCGDVFEETTDTLLGRVCRPDTGSCVCTSELDGTTRACRAENEHGSCLGEERCDGPRGWVGCDAPAAAPEVCDGRDNDCDGELDEGFGAPAAAGGELPVGASCGVGLCAGGVVTCDGPDAAVCSTATQAGPEVCNELDDDCDGLTDEDVQLAFYRDRDGDGRGDGADAVWACAAPDGYVPDGDDCDDGETTIAPGAPEICNGRDDDCDGETDEGFAWLSPGDEALPIGAPCGDGACTGGAVVCADGDAATCSTLGLAEAERCDDLDQNCDGVADDGCDDDGDGYCDDGLAWDGGAAICPEGGDDCDDDDEDTHPGADERCDGVDDDCDGETDEAVVDCASNSCAGAGDDYFETGVATCEDGACFSPAAVGCGHYTCADGGAGGDVCATSCVDDATCVASAHCDEARSACAPDLPDGAPCLEPSDCVSGHCQNGFCCAAGDCCSQPADCPADYRAAPSCDEPTTCQGTRRDSLCVQSVCALGDPVDDDSACDDGVLALDCAPYPAVHCGGAVTQQPPTCAAGCASDAECRAGFHCDGECLPDVVDGGPCDEVSDCVSGHCQNGFCCAAGDCCAVAADCPDTYRDAALCDDALTCQGHRVDATCRDAVCGSSERLPDDSGCDTTVEANPCGFFLSALCSGGPNQIPPECAYVCSADEDCDEVAHCDEVCLVDLRNGAECDEDSDCASGHCQNGLCCDEGDCCNTPGDCPPDYGGAPSCDFPSACQGSIDAVTCEDNVCGSAPGTPDDSACTAEVEANTCGLYPSVFCDGSADQQEPRCAVTCEEHKDCDDGAHCAGGVCVPNLPDGQPCVVNDQCLSNHCANGFCCAAGVCCAQPSDCPEDFGAPPVCDDAPTCQGTRRDPVCVAATCDVSDPIDDDSACTAETQANDCGAYQPTHCTGAAVQVEPLCGAACGADDECDEGFHCDGTCQPDLYDGLSCDEDSDCISGHCQNGFCCAAGDCCNLASDCPEAYGSAPACDDEPSCQGHRVDATCDGAVCGSTAPIPDDRGCGVQVIADPCGLYVERRCAGTEEQTAPACPLSCAADAECDPGAHCDDICLADLPDGAACDENTDCTSGHCQNGFCCAAGDCCASAADCPSAYSTAPTCDFPTTCQGTADVAVCVSSVCGTEPDVSDDSACTSAMEAKDCGLYPAVRCVGGPNQTEPACPSACGGDAECDEQAHCDDGQCLADLPDGQPCDEPSDCVSGHCQNGFCCAAGDCCAAASDCSDALYGEPSLCHDPAGCQGSRRDPVCSGSRCQLGAPVDDDSGCAGVESDPCGLYPAAVCSGDADQTAPACAGGCARDADCDAGAHCDDGQCLADLGDGNRCDEDSDCLTGHCQNGFCCATGDCCDVAASCPASYRTAATCDDSATCQGHRIDAVCQQFVCGSSGDVPDDSGCGSDVEAAGCGLWVSAVCTGAQDQTAPQCPRVCSTNAECDPGAHCDGVCLADLADGAVCDENSDCASGHCQNGFCCSGGDCCALASDCPESYGDAPVCGFPTTCQGTADTARCVANVCQTETAAPNDTACTTAVEAKDCGPYPAVFCDGTPEQREPQCAAACGGDSACDEWAHCDDGQCLADLVDGAGCDEDSDCVSGHCQNGFCCSDGDCCAQAADCPASYTAAATCASPATCQGTRRDAVCVANVCGTTEPIDDDSACDGDVLADDCGPFLPVYCTGAVNQPAPQCASSCAVDSDCVAGFHCDGTCQADLADGLSCDEDSDCVSGHCQNGFCCAAGDCCDVAGSCPAGYRQEVACLTPATCQGQRVDATCAANVCGSTAPIDDDSACDATVEADDCGFWISQVCTGQADQAAPSCPLSCAGDGDCDPGAHCDDVCVADLPNGGPCDENSDCTSGHCQNGFCCAAGDCCAEAANCPADVYGQDPSCDSPALCQGTRRDPRCLANRCELGPILDDDSGCAGVLADDCGLYPAVSCSADEVQSAPECPSTCVVDGDCDAGAHCDGGRCESDLPAGQACDEASDCADGLFCADGVCCTTACTGGLCRRCDVPGSEGTCSYVASGVDPDGECGALSCAGFYAGWDGDVCRDRADLSAAEVACDGAGGCQAAEQLCPLQPAGDPVVSCHPDCQTPMVGSCVGTTGGVCLNVNPGTLDCGIGACARTAPACVNGAPNTCLPGSPTPELCNGVDDDCDGLTDAADPADLVTHDGRVCENPNGVCSGCQKPATACTDGTWDTCGSAEYATCSDHYEPGAESSCDGRDNDCDGAVDDDFGSDPNNCGACGNSCTNGHGTTACVDGECVPNCDVGWDSCDGDPDDGCETSLRTLTDCGECGEPCALDNASESCAGGVCELTYCTWGYGDCDGQDYTGCEVDLDTQPSCAGATDLGSVCGDEEEGFFCPDQCTTGPSTSGYGEKWFKIYVDECSSCDADVRLRVRLLSPPGIDYDLYLHEPCGTEVARSRLGAGQTDEVTDRHSDGWTGGNDGGTWYIHVEYYSGDDCAPWTLQIKGGCPDGW